MLAIAASSATSLDDLMKIKGVPRGLFGRRGDELMAALERGRGTPPEKQPRFPKPLRYDKDPRFDERLARLRAVRDAAAHRLALDPGVLCSREKLEAIARRNPRSLEELAGVEGLRKWQVNELGEEIIRALRQTNG
jgi:ribonuclease D